MARSALLQVRRTAAEVEMAEAARLQAYVRHVSALDAADRTQWKDIVTSALRAGIGRDELARSFACNSVTIARWGAGLNTPGPMARKAIKAELIAMLEKLALPPAPRPKVAVRQ